MKCPNCNSSFTSTDSDICPFCGSTGPFIDEISKAVTNNTEKIEKLKKKRNVCLIVGGVCAVISEIALPLIPIGLTGLGLGYYYCWKIKKLSNQ